MIIDTSAEQTMSEQEIAFVLGDASTPTSEKRTIIRDIANAAVMALSSLDDGADHVLLQEIGDRLAQVSTHRSTEHDDEVTVPTFTAPPPSQRVNVLGPNLTQAGCALGTMHVHAVGCSDIKRKARKYGYDLSDPSRGGNGWEIDVTSAEDITEAVYPAGDFEYTGPDDEHYMSYRGDIHLFPCVTVPESTRTVGAV